MDPEALDAAIASRAKSAWYTRGCLVGQLVIDLGPGEFRDKLVAYMNAPVSEIGHSAIVGAIQETLGISVKGDSMLRHRRRSCSCADEVYR